jgi:hypothetical protein
MPESAKRGTCMILFRGPVPELFRAAIRDDRGFVLSDVDDAGLTMDVDARFLGATQLYEPKVSTDHHAEYVPLAFDITL